MSNLEQNERAYQKQEQAFVGLRRSKGKGSVRYFKNVGLGFKTPTEAKEGTYVDKSCPFTSSISIRGRIMKGIVKTHKMKKTIIVRRDYMHFVSKYSRYEKRHKNVPAHLSPCFRVSEGDQVVIGQCRPIAKTVRFCVLQVDKKGKQAGVKLFSKK